MKTYAFTFTHEELSVLTHALSEYDTDSAWEIIKKLTKGRNEQ